MKKLAVLVTSFGYLISNHLVLAQTISIQPPRGPGNANIGYQDFGSFINAALRLAFIIGLIAVLAMLVWGAIEWIFSGGNKDAITAARNRIIHALVGLAILSIAFALVTLAGQFIGINLLGNFSIPTPGSPTPTIPIPT